MEKIRCYVIADDYRWHVLTDSLEEFSKTAAAYIELMSRSEKENNYYFKNIFLTEQEFLDSLRMMAQSKSSRRSPQKVNSHLRLV